MVDENVHSASRRVQWESEVKSVMLRTSRTLLAHRALLEADDELRWGAAGDRGARGAGAG